MQIIPVIDLKKNQVVLAKSGERKHYQPVQTPLCPTANPFDVIQRFLHLYPFSQFYIADLDAIMHQGDHDELIDSLLQQYPDIIFWIDNGLSLSTDNPESRLPNYKTIIGSESQQNITKAIPGDAVLSLDFKNNNPLGDPSLFSKTEWWPETIIVMTLSQIGRNNGPDFEKLKAFRKNCPHKQIVAAGGIRGFDDLLHLTEMGIQKALLASCLHSGQLTTTQIDWLFTNCQAKKYPT